MANVPNRVVVGNATGAQSGQIINTAKLSNEIAGDKELAFTLTNTNESTPATAVKIFPGCWRTSSEVTVPATNVTFSSDKFASWAAFVNYFKEVCTNIYGVRMETTSTDNYMNSLDFTEKDVTGKESVVKKQLSKYRVPVGSGFSETIELFEKDVNFVVWPGLELALAKLKQNTSITIYFSVRGWNKVKELNAMPNDIIA